MNRGDKSFDELVRQKLDQRAFGFSEQSWQKAEKMIEAGEAAGRGASLGAGAAIASVVVAAGIVAGVIVYAFSGNAKPDAAATISSPGAQTIVDVAPQDQQPAASNVFPLAPAGTDASAPPIAPSAEQPAAASSGSSQHTHDIRDPRDRQSGGMAHDVQRNSNAGGQAKKSASFIPGNEAPENHATSTHDSPAPAPGKRAVTQQPENKTAAGQAYGGMQSGTSTTNKPARQPGEALANEAQQPAALPGADNQNTSAGQPGSRLATSPSPGTSAPPASSATAAAPGSSPAIPSLVDARMDSATLSTAMQDSAVPPAPAPVAATGVNYWYAQAGMSFIPGFSAGDRSGLSVNPVLGAGYNFRIGNRFSLQAGLRYTCAGRASDSSRVYTTTTYSFGVTHQRTEILLKRLHYASLPVGMYWRINGKHSLTAGGTFNYLFTSETIERTYTETNGGISDDRSRSVFGYGQGLNRFDAQLYAGYARTFGPHWSVEAQLYYGLLDIKADSWYGSTRFERNKGIIVLLQYGF